MSRPKTETGPPDTRLARFWGLGGTCQVCESVNPPTHAGPMFQIGYPMALFICAKCTGRLFLELAHDLEAEAITWHEIDGEAAELPDDDHTVLGMREGWGEPKPVIRSGGWWCDIAQGNTVMSEDSRNPERRPPTWWADWPAGPCDGKPRHGGDGKAA